MAYQGGYGGQYGWGPNGSSGGGYGSGQPGPGLKPIEIENSFVIVFNLDYQELVAKEKQEALKDLTKAYHRMVRISSYFLNIVLISLIWKFRTFVYTLTLTGSTFKIRQKQLFTKESHSMNGM